jgi:hypothetical protein
MANAPKRRPGKAVAATRPVEGMIHVIRGQKVKDMKALPPVTKRKIGFFTGED